MEEPTQSRFEVIRQVGAGAFGTVFEAHDSLAGGRVALKILHSTSQDLSRFRREAQVLARLTHPGIVRYVDHGLDARGDAYLAMEWLEGQTLEQRLEQGVLSLAEVAELGRRVADALGSALEMGTVHRDIKPANLFLPNDDVSQVKVLDFGLVRTQEGASALTHTGAMLGTPAYMSPEQAHGHGTLSFRSDVFSLGVVLYYALTGRLPFGGSNPMATLMKVCVEDPEPVVVHRPHAPVEISELVRQMLAKQPEERPDYGRIASTLSSLLDGDGLSDRASLLSIEPANDGGASLRARSEQRVLCALFVGPSRSKVANLEARLSQLFFDCGGYGQRLLDGTRVVMLDGQLAASDQAVAAAQCAQAVQQLLPDARVALCTGRAIVDGAAPVGELIDRGTALLRRAETGVVRLDEDSAGLLGARFSVVKSGDAHTLGAERRPSAVPRQEAEGHLSPFVGREPELMQLQALFDECVEEPACRALLVTAPAGAGKSRLRHEWRSRLDVSDDDFTVLVGRGDSVCQAVRFGVLLPALRSFAGITSEDPIGVQRDKLRARVAELLPAEDAWQTAEFLGEMLGLRFPAEGRPNLEAARRDPQLMADWVLNSWLTWVEGMCRERPLLLIVEDLHWADPASVRFLEAALRVTEELPLMVAAFARPELHEAFPKLWAGRDVREIQLHRLGARAAEKLLASRLGEQLPRDARRRLVQLGDGNPFFLEELARAFAASAGTPDLPPSVLGILQIRLDALGDDAKLLLRAASVFGQSFHIDGVGALLHSHASRLDLEIQLAQLEELDVVRRRPEQGSREYAFRHALICDAAYGLLTEEDRTLGHRLAARWLETRELTPPALLAEHYERGGCPELAASLYARASRVAMEGGTMEEVVRLGKRSVACGASDEVLGEAASLIAEALAWSGEDMVAHEWADRARQTLDPSMAAWWRASRVLAISEMRRSVPNTLDRVDEMVANVSADDWQPEQGAALGMLACEALYRAMPEIGLPILQLFPEPLPAELEGTAEAWVGIARAARARFEGDESGSVEYASRAAEACRSRGAHNALSVVLNHLANSLRELGQLQDAERTYREALGLAERSGAEQTSLVLRTNLGTVLCQMGQPNGARRELQRAATGFAQLQHGLGEASALFELARAELAAGELGSAREHAKAAVDLNVKDPETAALALAVLSSVELRTGNTEQAYAHAEGALKLLRERDLLSGATSVLVAATEAAVALERTQEARELACEAHRQLLARASNIRDATLRSSFLDRVPEHRLILQLFEELAG